MQIQHCVHQDAMALYQGQGNILLMLVANNGLYPLQIVMSNSLLAKYKVCRWLSAKIPPLGCNLGAKPFGYFINHQVPSLLSGFPPPPLYFPLLTSTCFHPPHLSCSPATPTLLPLYTNTNFRKRFILPFVIYFHQLNFFFLLITLHISAHLLLHMVGACRISHLL